MHFFRLICAVLLLAGCASMDHGSTQRFMVFTRNDVNIKQTHCNIKNEEGAWSVSPIIPAEINRDGNPMTVECENDTQMGSSQIVPVFYDKYLFQDILLLCVPVCLIDGYTNAFYQYPDHVAVDMQPK